MYLTFYSYFLNVKDFNIEDIKQMIENGSNDWNWGLHIACHIGHIKIIKLMIDHGADDWNLGLFYACDGGHIEIAKFMIESGANNWNDGLRTACSCGNIEIVNLLIEKGADNYQRLNNVNNLEFYKLYIKHGGDIDKEKCVELVIKQDPLYTIITHHHNNKLINKLPMDLWRYTKEFL